MESFTFHPLRKQMKVLSKRKKFMLCRMTTVWISLIFVTAQNKFDYYNESKKMIKYLDRMRDGLACIYRLLLIFRNLKPGYIFEKKDRKF